MSLIVAALPSMIAVDSLCKEFGRTRAVRNVSFHAEPGEVLGLLGPNGSGKTTIMRTLAGFFPPTSGRVRVAGYDVSTDSLAAREQIGYLPESVVLYPELRVQRLLEFAADVRRLRGARRRERLEAVIRACGLTEVRRRLVGQLSKGFRQRVGLAQALLHEPPVLILDEPTVGLDPGQILEMRELVGSLRGRTTILFSTHILSEAASLCDRVVIVDRGRVLAEDRADALTRGLEETERILVRVEGPARDVLAALQQVPGVAAVDPEGEGTGRFIVRTPTTESVHAAIAAAVVRGGWGLLEMRPVPPTLEDLFVRLVARGRGDERR